MPRVEYRVERFTIDGRSNVDTQVATRLNECARDGWRVLSIDQSRLNWAVPPASVPVEVVLERAL